MATESGSGDVSVTEGSQMFTWKLCNFSDWLEDTSESCITSPKFSVMDFDNRTSDCVIKMYLHQSKDKTEYLSVGICNIDDIPLILSYSVGIQDKNKIIKCEKFLTNAVICKDKRVGIVKFYPIDKIERDASLLMPDGSFTLAIKVTKPSVPCPTNVCTLPGVITDYLDDELADVKIICNGKVFACHRLILATNSPVFKAMLRSNFKESTRGEIIIDSTEPDILEEFLSFLYCGRIKNLRENAIELLKLADQYQVDNLKVICGLSLSLKLSTIVDNLILAFSHNESYLKKRAIAFVVKNIQVLMKTPEWKDSLAGYPEIMFAIMQALVDKNK